MAWRDKILNAWQKPWFSALLLFLAFPPVNLGLLVFVVYVPWLIALSKLDSGKKAFKQGYAVGMLFWISQMWWLVPLTGKWVGNSWLGLAPLLVVSLIGSTWIGLLGWLWHKCLLRGWVWAIPIMGAAVEVLRSFQPGLAFPYFLISTPLWPLTPIIQTASGGTQYLVSAWVIAINTLLFLWLAPREDSKAKENIWSFKSARTLLIPTIALLAFSLLVYMQPISGRPMNVTAGQPGVDLAFSTPEEEFNGLRTAVPKLYESARQSRSELLVLPEGIAAGENDNPPIAPFNPEPDIPVIFGGKRTAFIETSATREGEGVKVYQSAFGFDGKTWSHADKARLVVFGEYVPGRGILPFLDTFKLPTGDLTPASKSQALHIGDLKVGAMICFEGLFADVAANLVKDKAQLLAVISIDDWYMGTSAPDHLRAAAVWRAVENNLPIVRSGGLGYSMIINQKGEVLAEAPLGETVAITRTVYVPNGSQGAEVRMVFLWGFVLAGVVLTVLLLKQSK